jgi:hypothetical protein
MRRTHSLAVVALSVAALAALAGCEAGQPSARPAGSASSASATVTPSAGGSGAADPRSRLLEFARCMREHGVDVADPPAGEDRITINPGSSTEAQIQAAQQACAQYAPEGLNGQEAPGPGRTMLPPPTGSPGA